MRTVCSAISFSVCPLEYKDFANFPTCGKSRWKLGNKSKVKEEVPAKVLWYFPPIPRFQRMLQNKTISKELTWHVDKRIRDGYLRHPADRINPYSLISSAYRCWPILMITYNLSLWLCMKRTFVILTLLIYGPRQPGNDIDVYLAPLIDDLKFLWDKGVEAYDAYREESVSLRAILL